MKNQKAVFLIILGAFLMATGFAFAKEQPALETLKNNPFGTASSVERTPVGLDAANLNKALPTYTEVKPAEQKSVPPVSKAAEVKADAPKPTIGQSIKNFIGDHSREIKLGAIGGLLGWLVMGTVAGALLGGFGLLFLVLYM